MTEPTKKFSETYEQKFQDMEKYLCQSVTGPTLFLWPKMSHYLGGLRPHELTLLCAPTGAGKTSLLASIGAQLVIGGVDHFVAPVETGSMDFTVRTVSALLGQELNHADRVQAETVHTALIKLKQFKHAGRGHIANYDNRVDIDEMIAMLRYQHETNRVKVAILDNLNFFLKVTSAHMEKAEMDSAVHEFVMAAKKLPIHIILVVHPRKTDGGRVESEFDIKGSSTAVQEASNVILFNRPKREDLESGLRAPNRRELVFKKLRRRGMFVDRPIWFEYTDGRYREV